MNENKVKGRQTSNNDGKSKADVRQSGDQEGRQASKQVGKHANQAGRCDGRLEKSKINQFS